MNSLQQYIPSPSRRQLTWSGCEKLGTPNHDSIYLTSGPADGGTTSAPTKKRITPGTNHSITKPRNASIQSKPVPKVVQALKNGLSLLHTTALGNKSGRSLCIVVLIGSKKIWFDPLHCTSLGGLKLRPLWRTASLHHSVPARLTISSLSLIESGLVTGIAIPQISVLSPNLHQCCSRLSLTSSNWCCFYDIFQVSTMAPPKFRKSMPHPFRPHLGAQGTACSSSTTRC